MKIGLVGYEANIKHRVGSNQYAFELMKALYDLDKENEYVVFLPRPPLEDLPTERKNWRYLVAGPAKLWNWWGLPRAIKNNRSKLDLVFNPGHYAPLIKDLPLVISVMDLGFLRFAHQFRRRDYLQLKYWTSWSVKKAAHVLAISEYTRQDVVKTYNLHPDQVTSTPLGFDRQRFHTKISPKALAGVRHRYGLKRNYLLMLNTLKPSKNISGLLEAFSILKETEKVDLQLVIAGKKGWLYEEAFQQVRRLGLEKEVVFTGFVPDAEVPALMKGAELFVLPSFWEGFGIPVLEAMAVGTPVVASRVASLPEVVGEAGILVNPSSIESIYKGLKKGLSGRQQLVEKGLAQAQKFSWEKCAHQTLEVLVRAANLPSDRTSV